MGVGSMIKIRVAERLSFAGWKYRYGHGVHSPFVFNLIRSAFMVRDIRGSGDIYAMLRLRGVDKNTSRQINNVYHHCGYRKCIFGHNRHHMNRPEGSMTIVNGNDVMPKGGFAHYKLTQGSVLVVVYPRRTADIMNEYRKFIREGRYLSIDKRRFVLIFCDGNLPAQHFKF